MRVYIPFELGEAKTVESILHQFVINSEVIDDAGLRQVTDAKNIRDQLIEALRETSLLRKKKKND